MKQSESTNMTRYYIGIQEGIDTDDFIMINKYVPLYKEMQILIDADLEADKPYCAFPSIFKLSDKEVLIVYKRGYKHMACESDMDLIIFNPDDKKIIRHSAIPYETANECKQNPEILQMPNGDLVIYLDVQSTLFKNKTVRLGVKEFRSYDRGHTWIQMNRRLIDNTGIEYGYTFDDVIIGNTIFMLAMTFPELPNKQTGRSVHLIRSVDNGNTWQHVRNLSDEFGYAFNESSFEPLEDGFLYITRGDNPDTRLFYTDMTGCLIRQISLTGRYEWINQVGRPKLFIYDQNYYILMRSIPHGSTNISQSFLTMSRINTDTLLLESFIELEPANIHDGFYAEHYFQKKDGKVYFNVITYSDGYSDNPDILRLEYLWDEICFYD